MEEASIRNCSAGHNDDDDDQNDGDDGGGDKSGEQGEQGGAGKRRRTRKSKEDEEQEENWLARVQSLQDHWNRVRAKLLSDKSAGRWEHAVTVDEDLKHSFQSMGGVPDVAFTTVAMRQRGDDRRGTKGALPQFQTQSRGGSARADRPGLGVSSAGVAAPVLPVSIVPMSREAVNARDQMLHGFATFGITINSIMVCFSNNLDAKGTYYIAPNKPEGATFFKVSNTKALTFPDGDQYLEGMWCKPGVPTQLAKPIIVTELAFSCIKAIHYTPDNNAQNAFLLHDSQQGNRRKLASPTTTLPSRSTPAPTSRSTPLTAIDEEDVHDEFCICDRCCGYP